MKTDRKTIKVLAENKDKAIVCKSEELIKIAGAELTVTELKLIDLVCGRINPKDKERNVLMLTREEIKNMLGVKDLKKNRIEKSIKKLTKPIGERGIRLFKSAEIKEMKGCRSWKVIIECSKEKGIFFDLGKYTKYRLTDSLGLRTKGEYLLWLYIKRMTATGRRSWRVSGEELKKIMSCSEKYDRGESFLNNNVKRMIKNLNRSFNVKIEVKRAGELLEFAKLQAEKEKEQGEKEKNAEVKESIEKMVDEATEHTLKERDIKGAIMIIKERFVAVGKQAEAADIKDYAEKAYGRLKSAERSGEIHNREKYYKGILRNGNPANNADYFARQTYAQEEEEPTLRCMKREWDEAAFQEQLRAWEEEDIEDM